MEDETVTGAATQFLCNNIFSVHHKRLYFLLQWRKSILHAYVASPPSIKSDKTIYCRKKIVTIAGAHLQLPPV